MFTLIIIRVMLGLSVETTMEAGVASPMVWAKGTKGYTTHEQSKMAISMGTGASTAAGSSTRVYKADSDSVELKPVEEV